MENAKTITIDDAGVPRRFRIKKMNALDAESWIIDAGMILGRGVESLQVATPQTLIVALAKHASREEVKELLESLLGCCFLINEDGTLSSMQDMGVLKTINNPITILRLRVEACSLNFDFLLDSNTWNFLGGSDGKQSAEASEELLPAQTSRRSARQSSKHA